jgi:predicted RNA-binding protein with EMAP domain
MSKLDSLNSQSLINKGTTTELLKAAFYTSGQFKNSLLSVNTLINNVLTKDVKSITDSILKPLSLEDFTTPIDLLIKRSGEISTVISRLTVPTNLSGTKTDVSEGPYQMEAGSISFSTGTNFNLKAALSFNNSRQIVNRSQIIQTTADFIQEIGQQKYSKIESTYLESSKNRVEIVEEKDIVKAESIHSYASTYQNTAKNILIQAYPKKSKLGNLPIEVDIKVPLNVSDIIPDPSSIGDLAQKGLNAVGLDTKSISSTLGSVGKIASNVSNIVSTATSIASAVQNPRAFLTKTATGVIGTGLKAGLKGGLNAGISAAGEAFKGSSLGGIVDGFGKLMGGSGPGELGNIAAASLTDIGKGFLPGGLGNIGALASIPVMEGKAALFKRFGNIDAWPVPINIRDKEGKINVEKFIEIVKSLYILLFTIIHFIYSFIVVRIYQLIRIHLLLFLFL